MKKKFYLVLLLGISFLTLVNCAKPEFEQNSNTLENPIHFGKKRLSVSRINAEMLLQNPKMTKIMRNLDGKKLTKMHKNGRILESTGYFTLQMTDIVVIDENGYTSYTFAVLRENEPLYMENIIVNLYADGSMKTYFVEYEYTEAQKIALRDYNIVPLDTESKAYLIDNLEDIFTNNNILRISKAYNEMMCPHVTLQQIINTCPSGEHDGFDFSSCQFYQNNAWNPIPPLYNTTVVTYLPCGGSSGGPIGGGGGGSTTPEEPDPTNPELADDETVKTLPVPPKVEPLEEDCNTSKEDLKKLFPNISNANAELLAAVINEKGKDFGINTKEKLQHFLAQAGHETNGFNTLNVTENLNYSTASLIPKSYSSKFTMDTVSEPTKKYAGNYTGNPQGLANVAMCCDYGNGDEASGDGWKYRGRGIFQLTWKNNYLAFKTWYNNKYNPDRDFVENPDLVSNNDTLAILSGLWYYKTRVLDKITVDSLATVEKITIKVNGTAKKGLKDRKQRFEIAKDSIDCR